MPISQANAVRGCCVFGHHKTSSSMGDLGAAIAGAFRVDDALLDPMSGLAVLLGIAAVIGLHSGNADRSRRWRLLGDTLLGLSVSVLLFRWVSGVLALPAEVRPSWLANGAYRTDPLALWRCGLLLFFCGVGSVAAVKTTLAATMRNRMSAFAVVTICGAASLAASAAWDWALLIIAVIAIGLRFALWSQHRTGHADVDGSAILAGEPSLGLVAAAALLALLLGSWQHVVDHETQRTTRSPRYSAWPRPTALRDAWERTDWLAKTGDPFSAERATAAANHEQRIAVGLIVLSLLVVFAATWPAPFHDSPTEDGHAR